MHGHRVLEANCRELRVLFNLTIDDMAQRGLCYGTHLERERERE